MNSAISIEKKKKPIPPPMIAIHAAICLILDIQLESFNLIIESNCPPQTIIIRKMNSIVLVSIKDIGKLFLFVITGLVAIIVGSFMVRGTMHMWDKPGENKKDKKD